MRMESQPHRADMSSQPRRLRERLRLEQVATAVRELLRWWRGELLSMVPPRLRQLLAEPRLWAEASAREICIYRHDRATLLDRVMLLEPVPPTSDLAQGPLRSEGRCDVLLDRTLVLESPLTLPVEAGRELRRVLAFSMDRYTPFEVEEVYFDYRVVRRDARQRKIDVVLYAVPRKVVDTIVSRLALTGLDTVTVDVAAPSSTHQRRRLGINLLPTVPRAIDRIAVRINKALTLSAGLLLLLVLAAPLWQRHQAAVQMEQELAQLLPEVQAVERLRAEVDAHQERLLRIQQHKGASPAVLDVLLELTRLVPDEAWAGQIELREGRVKLSGEAVAASALMETLTASGYFADPRFEAPLTQNPKSERERFAISLAVKGYGVAH